MAEKIQIIEDEVFKQLKKLDEALVDILKIMEDLAKKGAKISSAIKMSKDYDEFLKWQEEAKNNTQKLTTAQKELNKVQRQIEIQEAKLSTAYLEKAKALTEAKEKTKALNKENQYAADSIKALREENKKWRKEMDSVSLSTKEGREQMAKYRAEIDKNTKAINKATDGDRKRISGIGKYKEAFQSAIATVTAWGAAILGAYQALSSVIETRAQFEKFEAVLTNALGSKSKAIQGMQMIVDFASKTPFAIDELTESYVKLVNRGFIPTKEEMTKLGDLASSTGKSFNQLVEAILDAQTGEFERLKEFGITSKKQGDNVMFTFKGVQTQVKATDADIKKYILSLGELNGVTGSMAAISETLGGKISNLGDKWTQLLNTTGKESSNFFKIVIEGLGYLIDFADWAMKSGAALKYLGTILLGPLYLGFDAINKLIGKTTTLLEDWGFIDKKKAEVDKTNELVKAENELLNARYKNTQISKDASKVAEDAFVKYKKIEEKKGFFEQEHIVKTKEEIKKAEEEQIKAKEAAAKREEEIIIKLKEKYDIYLKWLDEKRKENVLNQISYNELLLENSKETQQKETDELVLQFQKRVEKQEEAIQTSNELTDAQKEKRIEDLNNFLENERLVNETLAMFGEARLSNLQKERERELKLAGDNKEKQKKINEKYDKEEAKLRRKQAIREKAQALFELAILLAKQIATQQYFKAVVTAAQMVAIGIKKVPEFAKGVIDFKGGEAIIGEKGREILLDRTGKAYLSPDQATLTNLPAGASVIPNNETERILAQMPVHQQRVKEFKPRENALILELLKSNKRLENVIKRKKFVGININEKGFSSFMQQENSKTNIYSSYFRSKV